MFDEIVRKSVELRAKVDQMRKEAAEQVKPLLSEFVKANPQVKAVKWTQYTPYFNDGEPCEFSVHEPYFYFDGDDVEEDEGTDTWSLNRREHAPPEEKASAKTIAACTAMAKALEEIPEALEECFGDHCKVIVTASGVEVEEYDHD